MSVNRVARITMGTSWEEKTTAVAADREAGFSLRRVCGFLR